MALDSDTAEARPAWFVGAAFGGGRPVAPVTLLGERLVLFRDEEGELGLMRLRSRPLLLLCLPLTRRSVGRGR